MKFSILLTLIASFFTLNASEFQNIEENQITILTIDQESSSAIFEELTFEPTILVIQNPNEQLPALVDRVYPHKYQLADQLIISQQEINPETALVVQDELQPGIYISNQSVVLHILHEKLDGFDSAVLTTVIGNNAHMILDSRYVVDTICINQEIEAGVGVEKKDDEPGSISGHIQYTVESDDGRFEFNSKADADVNENGEKGVSASISVKGSFSISPILQGIK